MAKQTRNVTSAFIYKTGVVLIQGSGCGEWENRDISHIKSLLPEDDTPHFSISNSCEPSPIKVVHHDTPSKSGFSARSFLLAATSRISSFLNT